MQPPPNHPPNHPREAVVAPRDPSVDFQRGFITMHYLLGRRGEELSYGLAALTPEGERLVEALNSSERSSRAQALAKELAALIKSMEERRLR